ncbi:MAG: DUF3883 domain-containing protein [Bacteroidetes bacterium]|nr:DUF3883 domain-containing protein [Bacteroidota bacterium]
MNNLNNFIEQELAMRRRHYEEDPAAMIEHYNIEQQNIQAYNGRQLLEMLQNADDACETAKAKKVLVSFKDDELIIANNGEPFTEGGFQSITRSSLSPKVMQQNKIGQKGLGFRSILSWADEVAIRSGDTKLHFSKTIAESFLKEIIASRPSIAEFISRTSKAKLPIAVLRVPRLLNVEIEERKDYDTIITLKLKSDVLDDIQAQIDSVINKETLVFLNNIDEIEIDSPGRKVLFKRTIHNGSVSVSCIDYLSGIKESKTWHVNRLNGEYKGKNYELAIAWNDKLDDFENVLFSNFKTQVNFPFPALLHGTFELTQNRNQLENDVDGHNKFLTEKLAQLLIETAITITSSRTAADYSALRLLKIDFGAIDVVLKTFGFREKLVEKIKISKLFPTVNGHYITQLDGPVFYEFPVANYLRGVGFDDLLLSSSDSSLIEFLRVFELSHYNLDHFLGIISNKEYDSNLLAKVLYLILTYKPYKEEVFSKEFNPARYPAFLIDNEGSQINWSSKIFVQPNDRTSFNLPKSLQVSFLAPQLLQCLQAEFELDTSEAVVEKLKPFGTKKYDFIEITDVLVQHFNEKAQLKLVDVKELHAHLYRLFKNEQKFGKPQPIPSLTNAQIITAKGNIRRARSTYFARSYGHELPEALYHYDKSKILADKAQFGLEKADRVTLIDYFKWLGVSELPRYTLKRVQTTLQDKYTEFLFRSFKYPTTRWGWQFKSFDEFRNWLPTSLYLTVGEFDDIDKILLNAKIETILAWIKKDRQLRETLEGDREILNGAQLYFFKNTDRTITRHEIRSFTKWKFSTSKFVPIQSQLAKAPPQKCCLSKTITDDFSPFVERPKIAMSSIAEKLELSEEILESYLVLVGVHREISSFSVEILYEMLLSLPTSDREGQVAKSIYREIVNNFNENRLDITHPAYRGFLKTGKVLCTKGAEEDYYPINTAFYINTKSFGANILKKFPLICIDRKRGSRKVDRLFGVKPLENISFKIIGDPKTHKLAHLFSEEIDRFKALVYALRVGQDTKHEIRNRLKRLRIILVSNLKAEFIHNEKSERFDLNQYEFVVAKGRSTFYILIPQEVDDLDELKQNVVFCDSVSEIFTTLINTEEYRDFLHDLYSRREVDREVRLLSYLQQDNNKAIIHAKDQLDIIDDVRLSFWNAFGIATNQFSKSQIRNEHELASFLKKKLKLSTQDLERVSAVETFTQLSEIYNLEFLYQLFRKYSADYTKFKRHFSGLHFGDLFKNTIEDLKREFRGEYTYRLYKRLLPGNIQDKRKYFDEIDNYNAISYGSDDGFTIDLRGYFTAEIKQRFSISLTGKSTSFSYQSLVNASVTSLSVEGIEIPLSLRDRKDIQALLVFGELEAIKKDIEVQKAKAPSKPTNTIRVRGAEMDFENYEALVGKVLQGLDFGKLKLKISKTLPVEAGTKKNGGSGGKGNVRNVKFNSGNEETIGFVSELLAYHKLCEQYGADKIFWVSENASRAYPNQFMVGEAGYGYDLELTDEKGRTRFIEIKGVASVHDGIRMSKKEIKIALDFPDRYDLLIVENPLSNTIAFRYIKSPFKFRTGETLLSNTKMKVHNDNYIIQFKWDE